MSFAAAKGKEMNQISKLDSAFDLIMTITVRPVPVRMVLTQVPV
jgi:hypothetical protein